MMTASTTSAGTVWNGGVCPTCSARFVGSHTCSPEDLVRRAADLLRLADTLRLPTPIDTTRSCPCRPENGGCGVCGCTLGGPKVTC